MNSRNDDGMKKDELDKSHESCYSLENFPDP